MGKLDRTLLLKVSVHQQVGVCVQSGLFIIQWVVLGSTEQDLLNNPDRTHTYPLINLYTK